MTQDERKQYLQDQILRHVNEYGDHAMLAQNRLNDIGHECDDECDDECDVLDDETARAEAAIHANLALAAATMAGVATAALQRL